MSSVPADMKLPWIGEQQEWEYVDVVMSNCDYSVTPGIEEKLRSGKFVGNHTAYGFCGDVWWDAAAGQFSEVVNVFHVAMEIVSAPTLQELMTKVNDKYGWA